MNIPSAEREKSASNDQKAEKPGKIDKTRFTFTHPDFAGQEYIAEILGRVGKSTGRYNNCYNIRYTEPESLKNRVGNIDFSRDIDTWSKLQSSDATEDALFINDINSEDFAEAKKDELDSWQKHEVYDKVPYVEQPLMSTRWVLTLKQDENGVKKSQTGSTGLPGRFSA